ncbi:MAG: hypothetical protein HETSPECPRED_006557 [Heterodermia speciosa]|uniref:DUF1857-domain-containing protein n=1 Tax=Heterodermia speciosa TaxID=116794 RepID=A0A8H3FLK7_9LECA|nr:MAG: hypothetical protein HETSPECPRED_006557 [Heterodermia speciosa]
MVLLIQSQTLPFNPPGAEPVLNLSQIWEALLLKCRKPEDFLAPISGSEVLEETDTLIRRSVTFKSGMGPPGGKSREDIDLRKPWKADFRNLDNGSFISNIVSQGQDERDLHLTFYFEWPFPNIEAGSAEEKETSDQLWNRAKESVQSTIDHTRTLVKEGKVGTA